MKTCEYCDSTDEVKMNINGALECKECEESAKAEVKVLEYEANPER